MLARTVAQESLSLWRARVRPVVDRDWPFLAVLAAGGALRLAVALAYRPAIFYNDSFVYIRHAFNIGGPGLVTFAPDRPAGYPLVLRLLGVDLGLTTSLQHLAGLLGAVALYALMRRAGVGRWLAAFAAGVVLLDSYAVTLEQLILTEALFTLALTVSAALVLCGRRWWVIAAGFSLLAFACLLRNSGYFLIPAWILFFGLRHRLAPEPWVAALAGLALIFVPYLAWQYRIDGHWTPYSTTASGWFLYGRVAPFANCRGAAIPSDAARLCDYTAADAGQGPEYYLFSGGPARRLFANEYPDGGGNLDAVTVNRILRSFSLAIIKAQPLDYARVTASDFLKFFEPGASPHDDDPNTYLLMDEGRSVGQTGTPLSTPYFYNGSPQPVAGHPFAPSALLRGYQSIVHTPRWLLALCVIAVIAAAVLRRGARWRGRLPARPEQVVLIGGPLLALLGQAATAQFEVRLELPFVGLLIAGGAIALADLLRLRGWPGHPSATTTPDEPAVAATRAA